MKYKVGDKIRIKPIEWFKKITGGEAVLAYLSNFCGKVFTISAIKDDCYIIAGRPWMEEYVEPITGEGNADFLKNTVNETMEYLKGISNDTFINKAIIGSYDPFSYPIIYIKGSNEEPLGSLFPKMDDIVNNMKDYLDRTIGLINETSAIPSGYRQIPKFVKPAQKFKDGDILHCNRDGMSWTIIYKSTSSKGRLNYYCMLNAGGEVILNSSCDDFGYILATEEEKHALLVGMLRNNKIWNAESKIVQTIYKGRIIYVEISKGGKWIYSFKGFENNRIFGHYNYSTKSEVIYDDTMGLCELDVIKSIRLATTEEHNMFSVKLFLKNNVVWSGDDKDYVTVKKGDMLVVQKQWYNTKILRFVEKGNKGFYYDFEIDDFRKTFKNGFDCICLDDSFNIYKASSLYIQNLAEQHESFTEEEEFLSKKDYKKGDILINPRTRAYRIYGYGDDNLSSFRITNTDEKKYYLDYLKEVGLQPIPVRKKK